MMSLAPEGIAIKDAEMNERSQCSLNVTVDRTKSRPLPFTNLYQVLAVPQHH